VEAGGRGSGAGPLAGIEGGGLALEAEDARVHVGLSLQDRYVVSEVARGEVVRAVHEDVVILEEVVGVVRLETRLVGVDLDVGIQLLQAILGGLQLGAADVAHPEEDLAVQVAPVHDIEVHETETTHAGGGEVQGGGAAETARPDHEDLRVLEALLALEANLGEDEVAAVVCDLVLAERDGSRTPCDGGNDEERVAAAEGRGLVLEGPDVGLVDVQVDEGADLPLVVEQVGAEAIEAPEKGLEGLLDGGGRHLHGGLVAGVGAERRGDADLHGGGAHELPHAVEGH